MVPLGSPAATPDDMAISRIRVIQSWRIEFHHPFRVRYGIGHNIHLHEPVEGKMIIQPLPQEGIGLHRKYAPAHTDERGHQQRMPPDIRTNVECNASQRQDLPEYPSDPGLVGAKKKRRASRPVPRVVRGI